MLPAQVVVRRSAERFEVVTPRAVWPTVLGCLAFLLVGFAMLLSGGEPVLIVMGGAIAVFAIRWLNELRRSGMCMTADSIVERGDLRRRRWNTGEVERFFVDKTPHIVPWQSLWLELAGSEPRPLEQVRVLGRAEGAGWQRLERVAEDANDWLMTHRLGPTGVGS